MINLFLLILIMFSNSVKYAIRTVFYIAQFPHSHKCTVKEISAKLSIPKPYLGKILQQLSKNQIISSTKGRGGGFFLTKNNLKKSLNDIIICIDGNNIFNKCLLGLKQCSDLHPCRFHSDYKTFKTNLEQKIIKESIKDLIEDSKQYTL